MLAHPNPHTLPIDQHNPEPVALHGFQRRLVRLAAPPRKQQRLQQGARHRDRPRILALIHIPIRHLGQPRREIAMRFPKHHLVLTHQGLHQQLGIVV